MFESSLRGTFLLLLTLVLWLIQLDLVSGNFMGGKGGDYDHITHHMVIGLKVFRWWKIFFLGKSEGEGGCPVSFCFISEP